VKEYQTADIRNVAVVGHGGSGKTSLIEALLHFTGTTPRRGSVDEGTSVLDYDPEEMERKMTISTGLAYAEYEESKINIIDTPGYLDFIGEITSALSVVDGVLVVLDATSGVEVGTTRVWEASREQNMPVLIVVNKPDKEHADFNALVESATEHFGPNVVPVSIPVGFAASFNGVVDIISKKAFSSDGSAMDIPADLVDKVDEYRSQLVESVAETDEELLDQYMENEDLTEDQLRTGLGAAAKKGELFPLLTVCAESEAGAAQLLNAVIGCVPNPLEAGPVVVTKGKDESMELPPDSSGPLAVRVFKKLYEKHLGELLLFRVFSGTVESGDEVSNADTHNSERISQILALIGKERSDLEKAVAGDMGAFVKLKGTETGHTLSDKRNPVKLPAIEFPKPVIATAISAKTKGDEDKISSGLSRIVAEDPTLKVVSDAELRQTVIWGMGELHLDLLVKRLKSRFGVEVEQARPKIPYRETIKGKAEVQGKYKKQTGGRGQYGDVWIRMEPLPRDQEFEFVDAVVGGVVPGKFIPAVEKGIREAMQAGILAGYKVVGFRVTLYDGSYHSVDSSENAFKVAGSMAFKKAMEQAKPVLLEPINLVEVIVPDEFLGDVMGDLSSRRGKIQGVESRGRGYQTVRAMVPLSELDRYSTQLRSITQGRAMHSREFGHYEEVPSEISERVIAEAKAAMEE